MQTKINWTPQQLAFHACQDRKIRLIAFAGAAKSTSLIGYAQRYPKKRFLYLAFARSVADEAKGKFPRSNVVCLSTHQLAWKSFGKVYQHKMAPSLRLTAIAKALENNDWTFLRIVLDTLTNFLCSASSEIDGSHLEPKHMEHIRRQSATYYERVFTSAEEIWRRMIDPEDLSIPMLHDGYLKRYVLSRPDLGHQFDGIFLDEAQDTNALCVALLAAQTIQVISVGDPHQAIFQFRKAENAFDHEFFADATTLNLTTSFRFGPATAHVANLLLSLKGETTKVIGGGARTQIKTAIPGGTKKVTYINRTVMGVIETALHFASQNKRIYWVGKAEAYQIEDIADLFWLYVGDMDRIKNPRIGKEYQTFEKYAQVAEDTKDIEMNRALRILTSQENLMAKIEHLRRMTVEKEEDADVVVTTAHRCKGLEWPNIQLMEDFPDPLDPEMTPEDSVAEINLLYVALTRGQLITVLNTVVIFLMREAQRREVADSTPFGHSAHADPDTCSTIIRTGS
ncbi:UvrD-helicase domain-containing protein, partial [Pseudomonas aeruginosa]